MTRYLFVLSRRDPELYSYLQERFAGDAAVEIIVDRRTEAARALARPAADRRGRPDADAELLTRSYTIITVPDVGTGEPQASRPRRSPR